MSRKRGATVIRLNSNSASMLDEVSNHHSGAKIERHAWWRVLWLTGVDYFSTLAYQPGIAFLAAGALSPLATILLVLLTVFGALPVYAQVASRSYAGQGSLAMLEKMLSGWWSKACVLILLGFAATDFVITITLSAADAAQHIVENPALSEILGNDQMGLTLTMIVLLGGIFLLGFSEAIRIAMFIAVPFILMNILVLCAGVNEIIQHPEHLSRWSLSLAGHGDIVGILLTCGLVFPRLALGLSGFETGVSAMPLIESDDPPSAKTPPLQRIRSTQKLLIVAALLMSVMLIMSSFVSTLIIQPAEFAEGGKAYGRAISFLAHSIFGWQLGTIYDVSTIAILWFAGASAMTALLQIIPRYLPKFGMAPAWVSRSRPLVLLIVITNIIITLIFNANVEAQASAYATGVLVLILSAAFAVSLSLLREARACENPLERNKKWIAGGYFAFVTLVFVYTLADNILLRIDGIIVAGSFIVIIIMLSMLSRSWRSTEMRISEMRFAGESSARKFEFIQGKKVHLVAIRGNDPELRRKKADEIRKYYAVEGPLAFLHIDLTDDRSEFMADLEAGIIREDGNFVIAVSGANTIANTIAFVSEAIRPKSVFVSLTRKNPIGQALRYLFWGEGETGLMVYRILLRRWDSASYEGVRPFIFLMLD